MSIKTKRLISFVFIDIYIDMKNDKIVIYSLLPRLWGNNREKLTKDGTLEQNGSGKLADIDEEALAYISSLGATHLWCIGLLEHATTTAWEGILADSGDIVKGRAGSPYAVRDYYDIAPSICTNVVERHKEFDQLVERVHRANLKLIMDFIPNHVARSYYSDSKPNGVTDLGCEDDNTKHFDAHNNFYYFPNEDLVLPNSTENWCESPAKATGNDCFSSRPNQNDWYETIKLNYGVDYLAGGYCHFDSVPNTWQKMLEILMYWTGRGVDGFRCDMAEMVPEAFWAWAIPQVKSKFGRKILFLAEIYQPHRYESYLSAGFDFLYDKVGVYDTLRAIMRREVSASAFDVAREAVGGDRQPSMCYFLENHDEQRIASDYFVGNALIGVPALGVSLLSGPNPYLLYFAQELGEKGMSEEGFSGVDGRTTIFDYWALPCLQRLRRDYSGSALCEQERYLLLAYRRILQFATSEPLISSGAYYGLNFAQGSDYNQERCLSFVRYAFGGTCVLVVANFSGIDQVLSLCFPEFALEHIGLKSNTPLRITNVLEGTYSVGTITPYAPWSISLPAYALTILKIEII